MGDSVLIDQVRCRYRIRRHPNAVEVRWRLDRVIRDRVATLCESVLADRIPPGPGVVVIRRLDLKLVLSRKLYEPRVAELWSRAIAIAISRALAEGSSECVVRFESRAAQLARLCEDLAAGTAWSKWYHAPFSSLRDSSPSTAIRRALVERPPEIGPTLRILRRRGQLLVVGHALTDDDAWAIVAALPADSVGPPARQVLGPERLRDAFSAQRPALVALHLLAVLAEADAVTPRNVVVVRRLALVAPRLLARRHGLPAGHSPRVVATGLSDEAATSMRLLLAEEPELLRAGGEAVDGPPASAPELAAGENELVTSYGGVYLLLPALAELDFETRLRAGGLAEDEVFRTAGIGRWLVLLKCLEPTDRLRARFDPGLVVAAGLASAPDDAALRRVSRLTGARVASALACGTAASPPEDFKTAELVPTRRADATWSRLAAMTLDLLARRLPGFGASSRGYLARNFLAGESRVRIADDGVEVTMPRAPLEVVLRVAGWGDSVHSIPWLPGGALLVRADEE